MNNISLNDIASVLTDDKAVTSEVINPQAPDGAASGKTVTGARDPMDPDRRDLDRW